MKIKPCPFCGGEAEYFEERVFIMNNAFLMGIKCKNCGGAYITSNPHKCPLDVEDGWNTRQEATTVYGYDIKQVILFAECCREAGITKTDLANVEDCCKFAIEATEKAMQESFRKSFERIQKYGRTD